MSAGRPLRIGSRGSALARWQAEHVKGLLASAGRDAEIVLITTTGDRIQDRSLDTVGGKGAFLKEIEEALLAGEVDLAVHSLKDVPTSLPAGLHLAAFLERADPRDVLVATGGQRLRDLAPGARVGTTSLRRQALVRSLRPDLAIHELRGNVDTRLRRLEEGGFDAILLAMAGLARLGRAARATEALDPEQFVPAPGQGAIVVECRDGDGDVAAAVVGLHHEPTGRAVEAERTFLAGLGGGCNVPLGAYCALRGHDLRLTAFVAHADGSDLMRGGLAGREARSLGEQLAEQFLARGAARLLSAS